MTTPETLPLPTSTYQLLLDAARRHGHPVDPGPGRSHPLPELDLTPS